MANPDSVPAGKYGKAALEKLGVWAGVEKQVARAENVRAALALVSRGEAPFGIVYATDALADKGVRIVDTFPPDSYPPIVYPAALIATSKSTAAKPLLDYLRSPAARGDLGEIRLRIGAVSDVRTQPGRGRHPRAESARCAGQRHLQPAAGDPRGLWPGALRLSREDAGRCGRPSAARPAAGRGRLRAAGAVRQARADRERARRLVRHRVRVPLDRRRAGVGADGIPADGPRDPAVDRGHRPAARSRRADAGRLALVGVRVHHAAARAAGNHHRHAAVVCAGTGRVRRDDHVRVQHSRRDADVAAGDLHVHAGSRRRCAGVAPVHHRGRSCRSSRWRRPNGSRGAPRRMHGDDRR